MKKILISAAAGALILSGCVAEPKEEAKPTQEKTSKDQIDTKNFKITLEQSVYTDERDPGSEQEIPQVLRLKLTVTNNAIEQDTFDGTKLHVTDKDGKGLAIYPYDNMIEPLNKNETKTGYVYFVATGKQPYKMTYTNAIKETFDWDIPTVH